MSERKDPLEVIGRARGYSREELIKNLKRHALFTQSIISQIKKTPNFVLRNLGTQEARKLNRMMREVFNEAYRTKQFTRTEINNRGVLYGVVYLKHHVIDLVLQYFHERWPECVICLHNDHNKKTSIIDESGNIHQTNSSLKNVVEKVSKNRPMIPYFDDIQFSGKEIFETLYKSQYIPERDNQPFFQKMIPKQCFELPGMRNGIEKEFRYHQRKLDYFLRKN